MSASFNPIFIQIKVNAITCHFIIQLFSHRKKSNRKKWFKICVESVAFPQPKWAREWDIHQKSNLIELVHIKRYKYTSWRVQWEILCLLATATATHTHTQNRSVTKWCDESAWMLIWSMVFGMREREKKRDTNEKLNRKNTINKDKQETAPEKNWNDVTTQQHTKTRWI